MANQVNGLLSPYLREKRIEAVRPYLKNRILDFGCGVGKLTELLDSDKYIGVDIDLESLSMANDNYPKYIFLKVDQFLEEYKEEKFNTIVSMAVIEHVPNPVEYLKTLKNHLAEDGMIVLTTPHPKSDFMHDIGSKIGLFSSHANEEHEELIDRKKIEEIATEAELSLHVYKRFLFGVNQLMILK